MSSDRDRIVFRVLRLCRGMTPSEVAAKCKSGTRSISPQTVQAWRKPVADGGTRHPTYNKLETVARAFGKTLDLVDVEPRVREEARDTRRARLQ